METVKTAKELAFAIKNNEEYIYVEGDLKNKVIRIKTVGKIAWAFTIGSLATAITCFLALPMTTTVSTTVAGPVGTIVGSAIPFTGSVVASTVVATALGAKVAAVAIGIGVAFGGVGGVVSLRDKYKIERKSEAGIILKRKK